MSLAEPKTTSKTTAKETATITINATGQSATFPILPGTVGPKVIDIRKLYNETGYFTFDPGYTSTGSCESKMNLMACWTRLSARVYP